MRSKKRYVYDYIQKCVQREEFTTQELSKKLEMQRSNLSAILNQLVNEKKIKKISGRPVHYQLIDSLGEIYKETSCFQRLIGCDGSLKKAVQLAKAAILYPQHSLPTLIMGSSGSGKSFFARLMYEFALENSILPVNAPFVKFNCRYFDGAEEKNVISYLLGNDTQGNSLLKQAEDGILFVDHINLLPAGARNLFFEMLEYEQYKINNVIVICAINDTVNLTLKEAFMAKFSVNIELLPLQKRSIEERFQLIQSFFTKEAIQMCWTIKINSELLRCILLYHCDHNIKQLMSDIKLGCANAYVREFNTENEELYIYIQDFPPYVRKGFLFYKDYRDEIEKLIPQNYSYSFSDKSMERVEDSIPDKRKDNQETVYDIIDQKVAELRERGIMEEDINRIIGADIETDLRIYTNRLKTENINKEGLAKIVDTRIIQMVEKFLDNASQVFGYVYPISTYYGLCLHLSATLERSNKGQRIENDRMIEIVEKYKEEYELSKKFSIELEKEFDVHLPIDETVFITMFICENKNQEQSKKSPVILIAMHGESTASSMEQVVNSLVKSNNTYAYDLSLEKDLKTAYEELKTFVKEIDRGKGILLLYDMGSLKTMGETIAQETGIKIRMMELPMTLIALDCSRKANCETDVDQILDDVVNYYEQSYFLVKESYQRQRSKNIIITLCMSGKGGAIQIKQYLEKNMSSMEVDILPYAVSDRKFLLSEINHIRKEHNILCIIGTYDPELFGIPFISIAKLFDTPVEKLPMLLALKDVDEITRVDYEAIYHFLNENLPSVDTRIIKKYLPKVIAKLKKAAQGLSQDQELGLFMHIACNINRILLKEKMPVNIHKDRILRKNKRLYNDIKDILKPIEEVLEITFSDDEIANIVGIIKHI